MTDQTVTDHLQCSVLLVHCPVIHGRAGFINKTVRCEQ
jgi:hypothetical protein